MSDVQEHDAPPPAAPPVPSPAAQLQAALDALNHPSNLDLHARLAAIHNAVKTIAAALMPLLPTE